MSVSETSAQPITNIRKLRKEVDGLRPAALLQNKKSYAKMRDDFIFRFLPHQISEITLLEKRKYKAALAANNSNLETTLYGEIWDDLLPNERLAIEHLYYEDSALVDKNTGFYNNIHAYIEAKLQGYFRLAKEHLKNALWEILHNSPSKAINELERDNANIRRKAQATMLNSMNITRP